MTATPPTYAQLDDIAARARLAYDGGDPIQTAGYDVPALVAEVRRLRGELGESLGRLATAKDALDAQALAERQRLARALADRNDEYDALKAEFDQFADVCSSHSADRCVEQVAMEDLQAAYERLGNEAARITGAATQLRAERDEALARIADARTEIAIQDVRATNAMRPGFPGVCDALAAVETHLVDPEYRPADTKPEVER